MGGKKRTGGVIIVGMNERHVNNFGRVIVVNKPNAKGFYDSLTEEILEKCNTLEDFKKAHEKLEEFENSHNLTRNDAADFIRSGAAELLGNMMLIYDRDHKYVEVTHA